MDEKIKLVETEAMYLRGSMYRQLAKGSPVWRAGQLQTGTWLRTWQSAFTPHEPAQTSTHWKSRQARLEGQSLLSDQEHRIRTVFAKAEHLSRSLRDREGIVVNETNMWEKEY